MTVRYVELLAHQVPWESRYLAATMADGARSDVGAVPEIRWVRQLATDDQASGPVHTKSGPVLGWFRGRASRGGGRMWETDPVIYLVVDRPGVGRTMRHELRHAVQEWRGYTATMSGEDLEDDAQDWCGVKVGRTSIDVPAASPLPTAAQVRAAATPAIATTPSAQPQHPTVEPGWRGQGVPVEIRQRTASSGAEYRMWAPMPKPIDGPTDEVLRQANAVDVSRLPARDAGLVLELRRLLETAA